jgi:hypothetical protein
MLVSSLSNKVLIPGQLIYCVSLNGSTVKYYYSLTTPQMGTPHIYIATTSTHFMEVFSFKLKQVHYNFVYITTTATS